MNLVLDNICLTIGKQVLIHNLSLQVTGGETVSVMGPSGCGKSSLLAYICGSLANEFEACGEVIVNGRSVTSLPMEKRRIGLLFQNDLLFPHMSVRENLAFALPWSYRGRARKRKVTQALEQAGLAGYSDADPASLSGGQRARISLMRTLLAEPLAVLFDEPFSRLDSDLRKRFRKFVFTTIQKQNIPALLVTHDVQDCSGRIINLQKYGGSHA